MQQRQPRLGDIVDDYCPRERRVTNHVVVALIGEDVKQTRCSTCEADHEYKQAKIPPQRRKKEISGALYQQVLDGMPRKVVPGMSAAPDVGDDPEPEAAPAEPELPPPTAISPDEGPVHRPLIRATLPRLTDEPPQRREPDFTVRNAQHARPGGGFGRSGFRGPRPGGGQGQGHGYGQGSGQGSGQGFGPNGNRAGGPKRHGHGGGRPGGPGRPGNSQGQGGPGNRSQRSGGHNHGGKKSSR